MLTKVNLTVKILFITLAIALSVWFFSDRYQTTELSNIFHDKLAERFSMQAKEHRDRFDNHIKSYSQAAKLYSGTDKIVSYVESEKWQSTTEKKFHTEVPSWAISHSVMRKFVLPRYTLLFDRNRNLKEAWNIYNDEVPAEILQISTIQLRLSEQQSYITLLSGKPYLVTTEPVTSSESSAPQAFLMLASPIDSQFMSETQRLATTSHTVALLNESKEKVLVSSKPQLIPSGSNIKKITNHYQIIGQGFFDYGASELVISFISFIPLDEVENLTSAVLVEERKIRFITALVYTLLFIAVILSFTSRLKVLTRRIMDFSGGMSIRLPPVKDKDELTILDKRFQALANAIKNETDALEHQASHDPLTELPNRKKLNEQLQKELLDNQNNNTSMVLLLGDLNHFKEVNDTLGHHIGDLVLQQAAERLYSTVRKTDTVARLGGDEFGILLPDVDIKGAVRIVQKIAERFEMPFFVEDHKLNIGISIGVVESPTHGDDVNILVQRVDVAMYNAKQNNLKYAIYDPKQDKHHISKLKLMSELRDAIENEKLELYYQPQFDSKANKIKGAEALIRWNHYERGMIQPDDFIPLAEQTGLIKNLTRWVISESIAQCSIWHKNNSKIKVSINISTQCLHDPKLIDHISTNLVQHKLSPEYFTLEITESDIMTHPIRAKAVLKDIKRMGVNISVDDFGTGYSSLSYLKQLPVSEIKIDRSFIMEMAENENDHTIVKAVIDLGKNLGHEVIAEGVENQETFRMLSELNCSYLQGNYICPPLEAEAFLYRYAPVDNIVPITGKATK